MVQLKFVLPMFATVVAFPWIKINHYQHILDSYPAPESSAATPVDQWFETQKLDHNDPTNTKTWRQRYHVNDEWFGGAGYPVFYLLNGENVANPGSVSSTIMFMNELAIKYKALVVGVEHRYYGLSQPVTDYSQALADFVEVQKHLIEKRNLTADNKWVTFGGSYPGMLSGWARLKYPNNFVGAVASSAPIWTKPDYFEYSEVVAFGLKYVGGDTCINNIGEALKDFHRLISSTSPEDIALFNKLFNPCSPIKDDYDRMYLEMVAYGSFHGLAQYHGLGQFNLSYACDHFAKNGTALEKLASFIAYGDECRWVDYKSAWIEPLLNTTASTEDIWRQWIYQTCAEFGFGQITTNSKSIFNVLSYIDVERELYEVCRQAFNITDTEARTAATRKKYGGLQIDVMNVVWPNGAMDPWSGAGITNYSKPVNPASDFAFTEGTAQCADMYARSYKKVPDWAYDLIERNVNSYLLNKC